jgi:hypothetical protein
MESALALKNRGNPALWTTKYRMNAGMTIFHPRKSTLWRRSCWTCCTLLPARWFGKFLESFAFPPVFLFLSQLFFFVVASISCLSLCLCALKFVYSGGMLTYLLPTTYDFAESDLPVHPCLELVQVRSFKLLMAFLYTLCLCKPFFLTPALWRCMQVCHQSLSSRHGRRAVVMRKYQRYTAELKAEYDSYKIAVLSGKDQGFGMLMSKLQAALDVNAFENENVVM